MAIPVKSPEQIKMMWISGDIVAQTHMLLEKNLRPGISTKELADLAEEYIRGQNAVPSFKGYRNF